MVILRWLVGEETVDDAQRTASGATLLHLAAGGGHLEAVKFLVEHRSGAAREGSGEKGDKTCACCRLDK